MSAIHLPSTVTLFPLTPVARGLWLCMTTLIAVATYLVIGIDQVAINLFGGEMNVHEFVHDGRHVLGFPCH